MKDIPKGLSVISMQRIVQPGEFLTALIDKDSQHFPVVVLSGKEQGQVRFPYPFLYRSDDSGYAGKQPVYGERFADTAGKSA